MHFKYKYGRGQEFDIPDVNIMAELRQNDVRVELTGVTRSGALRSLSLQKDFPG